MPSCSRSACVTKRGFNPVLGVVRVTVLGTGGFVHSGRARREKVLVDAGVARGVRRNGPLYVGVPAVDGGGDEVCHSHGGHVLAMDMGDRGARAHGEKGPRHWPDEGAVTLQTWLEPKWLRTG